MTGPESFSRRELLRGRFLRGVIDQLHGNLADRLLPLTELANQPQSTQQSIPDSRQFGKAFPILRPPGAIEEEAFLAGCTRCNACIDACPHAAIIHAPPRFRRAAGTPMIDPAHSPCMMCPDTPCITACEPRVLRKDVPVNMGVARIDATACLAHQHSFCTVCSEQCPVDGAIDISTGKPQINEPSCTGCGVCLHVCPAPQNAILLMPLLERSAPMTRSEPSPDG